MKKIFLSIILITLIQIPSYSAEKKDCSTIKKFTPKYLACKVGNIASKSEKVGLDTGNVKEKKYITDWFKKKK